jgi:hypothetical protein
MSVFEPVLLVAQGINLFQSAANMLTSALPFT